MCIKSYKIATVGERGGRGHELHKMKECSQGSWYITGGVAVGVRKLPFPPPDKRRRESRSVKEWSKGSSKICHMSGWEILRK